MIAPRVVGPEPSGVAGCPPAGPCYLVTRCWGPWRQRVHLSLCVSLLRTQSCQLILSVTNAQDRSDRRFARVACCWESDGAFVFLQVKFKAKTGRCFCIIKTDHSDVNDSGESAMNLQQMDTDSYICTKTLKNGQTLVTLVEIYSEMRASTFRIVYG